MDDWSWITGKTLKILKERRVKKEETIVLYFKLRGILYWL